MNRFNVLSKEMDLVGGEGMVKNDEVHNPWDDACSFHSLTSLTGRWGRAWETRKPGIHESLGNFESLGHTEAYERQSQGY